MRTNESVARMPTFALLRQLGDNLSLLLGRQIELAKMEARETAMETVRGAGTMIVAGVLALLAVVCLIVAGILALAAVIPGWLAGIIAGVVFAISAAVAFFVGKGELETVKARPLHRTRETIRGDLEWAKHRLSSSER